jgi:hypothetical protein
VADRGDVDNTVGVVNKVEDPVRSSPRRPQWRERRVEGFANPAWGVERRSDGERVGGGDLFR